MEMDFLVVREAKLIVEEIFDEAYTEDENDIEEKYDDWVSDFRHQEVDDHINRMDDREVNHLLCRFGISKAFQQYMDEFGIDKTAPTERALLYCILHNVVYELTSFTAYDKWNKQRQAYEQAHEQQGRCKACIAQKHCEDCGEDRSCMMCGDIHAHFYYEGQLRCEKHVGIRASGEECPICYEGYGEKPNGDFLCKDGKANSPYAEECKHYACVKCCIELSKAEHVKCPLCREDWTEWIHAHYGEAKAEVSDDDEEDE